VAAINGGPCHTTCRRGRPRTITFAAGATTAPGSPSTRRCASARGAISDGEATLSAAILDSQSVKTGKGGRRGYDAHKQVSGRKRHLLVDTQGFVLKVVVSATDVQDRDGARLLAHAWQLYGPDLPRLSLVRADAGYSGQLVDGLRQQKGWRLEEVQRRDPQPRGTFAVQPHRWIEERCLARVVSSSTGWPRHHDTRQARGFYDRFAAARE